MSSGSKDGAKTETATLLTLTLASFFGFDLFTTLLHACQLSGRPGENDAATAVADGEDSRALRRHTLGKLGDDGGETLGIDARDRNHRLRGGAGDDAAATADQAGSSTDELCDGEEFTVVVSLRATAAVARRPCEWPMTAAGGLPATSRP